MSATCLCYYLASEQRAAGVICTPCQKTRQGSLFATPSQVQPNVPAHVVNNKPDVRINGTHYTNYTGAEVEWRLGEPVRRTVQPKAGTFRDIHGGQPTGREFRLVEHHDGTFWWEFTDDGERRPATVATTRVYVDDHVAAGMWVEVER